MDERLIINQIKDSLEADGDVVLTFAESIADIVLGQGTPDYEGMDDDDLLATIRVYVKAYCELTE